MRNITEKDLKTYKKIFLINSKSTYKEKKITKNACYIYINNLNISSASSYTFSWSEFKKGYHKRCQISKIAFRFSFELEKKFRRENFIFFKFLNFRFAKKLISTTLKKSILNKIYEYFYLFYVTKELKKKCNNIEIINTSKDFNFFEKKLKSFKREKILINQNIFEISDFLDYTKNIFFIIFYQLFSIFLSSKISFKKKQIKFGLRFFNSGFNLNTTPRINWLFNNINKKKYHIICEDLANKDILNQFEKKKINFIVNSNKQLIKNINLKYIPKYLTNIFFYFFLGILTPFKNRILINFSKEFITSYIKWEKFTDVYKVNKYISYHNYNFEHIIRNFLLNQSGCETFHYKHTFAENIYENQSSYNNYIYGFLTYNYEFHWSPISKEMSIKDKSQSKKFISNGPISSQYINKNSKRKKNLICFFTTQLGSRDSICSKDSHEKFLNYIENFSKNKKFKIILKPKYKIKNIKYYYPEIYKKVIKLKKIKNIKVIEYTKSEKFMFKSHKIISMPFASTTIQGIYNNIPSFYLDLNKQFNNVFYKKNNIYFTDQKIIEKKLIQKKDEFKKIKEIKEKIFRQSKNTKKIPDFLI